MPAAQLQSPLIVDQGTDYSPVLSYYAESTGAPIPLNAVSAKMEIRTKIGAPVVMTLSSTDNTLILDNLGGKITMVFKHATNILTGLYVFDIKLTAADGSVKRFIEGKIKFSPQVTV